MASNLAQLQEKVVTLQSSTFENAEQVWALNLALIRVETQRDGKARVQEDNDSALESNAHDSPPHTGHPPPRDYFREEEDDYNDTRFHPTRLEFPTFNGKEDPLPWLNRYETFFRSQNMPERRRVWYAAMHLAGVAQLWYYKLELTAHTPSWCRFAQLVQQ